MASSSLDGEVVDVHVADEAALLEPFAVLLGQDVMARRPFHASAAAGGLAYPIDLRAFPKGVHAVHGGDARVEEDVTACGTEIGVEAELREALANVA